PRRKMSSLPSSPIWVRRGAHTPAPTFSRRERRRPSGRHPIPSEFDPPPPPRAPAKKGPAGPTETITGKRPRGKAGTPTGGPATRGGKPGGTGKGTRSGGRAESTMFFGTEARGNRFVFVVDNSSSMKGGRLEMAISELIKTVESLSPRQSFYVIFVSDKTYP